MEQNHPVLVASEENDQLPILIVDKKGMIGNALSKVLREQFLVVVVSGHTIEKHDNVIHVPYHKKLPLIPDNTYSHIFIVYNGERELLEMLSVFEEKVHGNYAKLFFITSLLLSSAKLFAGIRNPSFPLLQTVLYGETFDNNLIEPNEINFFIHQARSTGRIELPKEGLGKLYPVLLDDVVTSLVSLAFAIERPKETIFLFPHHTFTQVSLARMLQKIEPLIKVDFKNKKVTSREIYIPHKGLYFFRDYHLEERLHKIDLTREKQMKKGTVRKLPKPELDPEEKQTRSKLFFIALFAIFIAPILLVMFITLAGYGGISLSLKQLEQGNLETATTAAKFSQGAFQSVQMLSPTLLLPKAVLPGPTQAFVSSIELGKSVTETEIALLQSFQVLHSIYKEQSLDPKNDFLKSLATVKNAFLNMQKLEAENKLPPPIMKKLTSFTDMLNITEGTIDTWPTLFGFENKKTYLMLFQNNMELRPGGGFIGSYGLLSIKNGKSDKLQIHNVYDADGQLKEHVEPPYGLRRYLGVSHLFLRDSNFDPDFIRNSALAQQLLQKETGQKVDGVIAIDTAVLKNLIGILGSVDMPDYHQTVTADNFYLVTQTHAEKNSFAGSTQKQDFLRSLTNALMNKLLSEKHLPYQRLTQLATEAILQKHLLFAFSDQSVQNVFSVNGLSSTLQDDRTSKTNTAFDYTGVVDANVGTNKANFYVKRSLVQSVKIDGSGGLQATASATYTNTSTKISPFGGEYRDFVQFIIPESATFDDVLIDNKSVEYSAAITDPDVFTSEGFTPPPGLEVQESTELGKKVIGFFFIVPQGQTKTVSISYNTDYVIDTRQAVFTYDMHIFKQPGTVADPYQLWISYPPSFNVVVTDKRLSDVGGKLGYSGALVQDTDVSATFSKK